MFCSGNDLLQIGNQGGPRVLIPDDYGCTCGKRRWISLRTAFNVLREQPYRSRKLGSSSLQLVLDAAEAHTKPKIDRIYLHVQTSNSGAKRFYERHGFTEIGVHENYYKKIVPHDAWILEKKIQAEKSPE